MTNDELVAYVREQIVIEMEKARIALDKARARTAMLQTEVDKIRKEME